MEIQLQQETFGNVLDEIRPLLVRHWREISAYPDIPLNVDEEKYETIESIGNLRIYTVRLEGKLIGYAVFFLGHHIHYSGSFQATEDVVYVDPDFRLGSIGVRLLQFSDSKLKEEGVQVVHHHVKLGHPVLGLILQKKLGYVPVETIYSKRLDS